MALLIKDLCAERALIFRITHIQNLHWILQNGLHSRNSNICDPDFVGIGNPDLIHSRHNKLIPNFPTRTLSDYIPFYFTPASPMLLNILTGRGVVQRPRNEIIILVSSLRKIGDNGIGYLFTDRHAYMAAAQFYNSLEHLDQILWDKIQQRDFQKTHENPDFFEKYQAEALIYEKMPVDALSGIACFDEPSKILVVELLEQAQVSLNVVIRPQWYFQ